MRALTERDPNFYPLYTDGGRWRHEKPAWTHWCDGFLPGMMWIFYEETGDPKWRELAESYSKALEPRKDDREVHDLGFIFYHGTYRRWYEATVRDGAPDQTLKEVVIHAGRTLALRFDERAGCLRSFHGNDSNFIDIMMNVGIIFYAALETKDPALLQLAHRHCLTTRRTLVRGDGSTSHEGIFDRESGEFLRQTTQQGLSRRFMLVARAGLVAVRLWHLLPTDQRADIFGDSATERGLLADAHPENGIAPWDFDAPEAGPLSRAQVDTSASAIAAVGLFNLAEISPTAARRKAYLDCALKTVDSLSAELFGRERRWLGRHPARRRLSHTQRSGCR